MKVYWRKERVCSVVMKVNLQFCVLLKCRQMTFTVNNIEFFHVMDCSSCYGRNAQILDMSVIDFKLDQFRTILQLSYNLKYTFCTKVSKTDAVSAVIKCSIIPGEKN